MEILYLMVPLGLVLVAFGVWAFFWAVGSGQFDDLDSPGWTVLDDDKSPDSCIPTAASSADSTLSTPDSPAAAGEDRT
jgi:cbb3-type cytochrome oxidase maturation protein